MKNVIQLMATLRSQNLQRETSNFKGQIRRASAGLCLLAGCPLIGNLAFALLGWLALGASSLCAQTTWTYTGTGNLTWESTSWTPASTPDAVGGIVTINANAAGTRNVTIGSSHTIASLSAGRGGANSTRMYIFLGSGVLTLDNTGFAGKPFVGQSSSLGYQEYPIVFAGTQGVRFGIGATVVVSGNNTFSGDVEFNRSTTKISHTNALPHGARTGNVTFVNSGSGYGTMDLGLSFTINGLSSPAGAGTVTTTTAGTKTLTVGDNDQGGNYGGVIQNGSGSVALTKIGNGTLTLSGAISYGGATAINGGVLQLSGATTLASSSSLIIGAGGTLDVTNVSTLPYQVPVSQTFGGSGATGTVLGDVTLGTGAPLTVNYASGTPTLNVASGALTLDANPTTITITGSPIGDGSYKLISKSGSGAVAGTVGTVAVGGSGIVGGGTASLAITGGELFLNVTGGATVREWGSGNGTWAVGAAGWGPGGGATFANGNAVLFTDPYSSASRVITLNTTVLPQSVFVISTNHYTITGSGAIDGLTDLRKLGAGALTLDVANTHTGGSTLFAGTLNLKNASALGAASGTFTIAGGTLDNTLGSALTTVDYPQAWNADFAFTGSSDLNLGIGPVTLGATRTVTVNAGSLTAGGDVTGVGYNLIKAGAGTLALNGAVGTDTGSITVNAGTLTLGGNNTFAGGLTINSGEVIANNAGALNSTLFNTVTMPDTAASKILSLNGSGTITVYNLSQSGTVNQTTAVVRNNHAITPATLISKVLSNTIIFLGRIEDGGAAPLALTKTGGGIFKLGTSGAGAGNYTYSGNTIVSGGTLQAGANSVFPHGAGKGNMVVNATLDMLDRSITLNGLSGVGIVAHTANSGATALSVGENGASADFAGKIQDGPATFLVTLTKLGGGTQTLTGTNTYTGVTTISGGVLQIGNGGPTGSIASPSVVNNATLVFDRDGSMTYSGVISDIGNVTNKGPGIVTLTGANTYTGTTTVTAGTLRVNSPGSLAAGSAVTVQSGGTLGGTGTILGPVTVESGGGLAPGASIGTLTVNNTVTLQGATVMEVSRDGGTATSDLLTGVTTLNYGGDLIVTNIGGTTLRSGDSFTLFSAATRNLGFANVTLPPLLPGLTWNNTLNASGTLTITGTVIPPNINSRSVSGDTLTMSGTGGVAGGYYYVLTSLDVSAPIGSWTSVATNVFDNSGNFSFQQTAILDQPQQFYMIAIP